MTNVILNSKLTIITELAEHARLALQAAQAAADQQVRFHVDRMRHLRAQLKRKSSQENTIESTLDSGAHDLLARARSEINGAESFIEVWSKRYLQIYPRATLLESLEGCHAVLDAELPATWDWDHDLLACVVNSPDHPLLQALKERNQKRLMIIMEGRDAWTASLPPQWRVFQTGETLAYEAWTSPPIGNVCNIDTLLTPESLELLRLVQMGLMNHLTNAATFRVFGERWLKQGLQNLTSIARYPSWSALRVLAENRPAVIVSPGPSLQKNMHLLKGLQDRVLIIATAQAIMALQAHGIAPHVVVVSDPQDMSHYFSGYVFSSKTVLAVGRTCAPALFKLPAHHFISHPVSPLTDGWINKILNDEQFLDAGGSVAITAFSMALHWSCQSIALIGQDLAFDGSQQYAAGTADADLLWDFTNQQGGNVRPIQIPHGIKNMHQQSGGRAEEMDKAIQLMELPGYFGGRVKTKTDYFVFHGHFVRMAHELSKLPGVRPSLYNCTEGGAHIPGYQQSSLQDWLDLHVKDQPAIRWEEGLDAVEKGHDQHGGSMNRLQIWKKETISALRECSQSIQTAQNIFKSTLTQKKSQELKAHENVILDSLDKLEFISIAYQQSILDAIASIHHAHDHESAIRAEQELVEVIRIAIENFSPSIEAI